MGSGVAPTVLLLFLLPWENAARTSEVCPRFGRRRDCDRYDSPAGKDRVCMVSDGGLVEWYTDAKICRSDISVSRDLSNFCPGYVGMNMSLGCNVNTSVIYKDGILVSDEPAVTFNGLQAENEGLYQCRRRGSLEVIHEFNMTVQNEIRIGGGSGQECVYFICDLSPISQCKCCYYGVRRSREYYSQQPINLSVYGDDPISVSLAVEWITDSTVHYPTDLDPYIRRNSTNPIGWELNFRHYPDDVNDEELRAVIVVTATNNISSFSVCVSITFDRTRIYNADTSLPQGTNTTIGGDATFVCEFGSNQPDSFITPLLSFEISLASEDGNSSITFTTDCRDWENCDNWSPDQLATTRLSIRSIIIDRRSNFILCQYEVQLTNVVQEFNGSQFSCSISTGSPRRILQWKGTAELIVERPAEDESPIFPPTTAPNKNATGAIIAAAVVLVVIILAVAVAISLLLVTFTKRRSKRPEESYELAQVPLTTLSTSTVVSRTTSPDEHHFNTTAPTTEQHGLPAISIMGVGGVRRDIIVGREMLHETRSMDSGVSCSEYDGERKPLGMTRAQQLKILEDRAPVRLCRSEADILDSPSLANGVHTPRKKSVIYISYTDHASKWVRSTLKPMIESWNVADVMLPERDMVAGKAISNERRRLIVEADKIIVVVSPDYYDSEWCSYELMHAIQNEPTLSRGRIIPVLIDGCKLLPKNMEVVVPLFAHEQDFSQRLQAAIHPHSTPRLSLQ